ncbi:MAG: hypothetical protein HYZ53_01735 [Planctomycetes bacterium]|nr:hypothetical protein [Planctomycetota bacterium]
MKSAERGSGPNLTVMSDGALTCSFGFAFGALAAFQTAWTADSRELQCAAAMITGIAGCAGYGLYRRARGARGTAILAARLLVLGSAAWWTTHGFACIGGFALLHFVLDHLWLTAGPTRRILDPAAGRWSVSGALWVREALTTLTLLGPPLLAYLVGAPGWAATLVVLLLLFWGMSRPGPCSRIATALLPLPGDLDPEGAARIRRARSALRRRSLELAEALLDGLPRVRSVRVLQGLVEMERARRGLGLRRAIWDAEFAPSVEDARHIAKEIAGCTSSQLAESVAARFSLLDDLLADLTDPRPLFVAELCWINDRLFPAPAFMNLEHELLEGALRERKRRREADAEGGEALRWLVARLWHAGCSSAAVQVARMLGEADMLLLARLRAVLDGADWTEPEEAAEGVRQASFHLLALSAHAGRWRLDHEFLSEEGRPALREELGAHPALVDRAQALWQRYEPEIGRGFGGLQDGLVGRMRVVPTRRARLTAWWCEHRAALERYLSSFGRGLEEVEDGSWLEAAKFFADAQDARPDLVCAAYNRAYALREAGRLLDAEQVLCVLAGSARWPAFYWLRLGEVRHEQGRRSSALGAWREAVRRGELEVADHALAIARLQQEGLPEEGRRAADSILTGLEEVEELEEWAAALEAQGEMDLAALFGRKAFELGLTGPEGGAEDGTEEPSAGPAG